MSGGRGGRRTSASRPSALEVGASQRLLVHDGSFLFMLMPKLNQFRALSPAVAAAVRGAGIGSTSMILCAKEWSLLIGWMGNAIIRIVSITQHHRLLITLHILVIVGLRPPRLDLDEGK